MIATDTRPPRKSERELTAFLRPGTVAIVGASRNPRKVGNRIISNLLQSQYEGAIVPVNPSANEILGLKCYKDLKSYGANVEHSVIVVPRDSVKRAVEDSISAGAQAISIISAGFKEQDKHGAVLEREVREMCRRAGVRVLGPNCLGLLNTHHHMDISFGKKWPMPGNMAFVSQSGALCAAVLDRAAERKFGLSKMISIGNKADLNENDFLAALGDDPDTGVIVAYLEGIDNGQEFMAQAEAVSRKKPIIVFKSGVTDAGSQAASSHTGSLAGADIAYDTAFRRCGIVRPATYEQMFEFAIAFAFQPLPKGRRVAVITNAGGPGIMATDAVVQSGLEMAMLEPRTRIALRAILPDAASTKNPIDVLGDAAADRYDKALKIVQQDSNVDAVVVLLTPQAVTQPTETANAICAAAAHAKPILACFLGGEDVNPAREIMMTRALPDYRSPEKAVLALKAMCEYAEWKRTPPTARKVFDVDRATVEAIIKDHRERDVLQINEVDAKTILRAYGVPLASCAVAVTASDVTEKSRVVGFPLVMKIVSPDIVHKSDVQGVKLFIQSEVDACEAYEDMLKNVAEHAPHAHIDGVFLERMCPPGGREVIIGMNNDPQFGPMVMFGLGGIYVEVFKDVSFRLAPVRPNEAMQMIRDIKAFPLLAGVRGQTGVDTGLIAEIIQRVSQLVIEFPQIKELDINPFIAYQHREDSIAADARITLSS